MLYYRKMFRKVLFAALVAFGFAWHGVAEAKATAVSDDDAFSATTTAAKTSIRVQQIDWVGNEYMYDLLQHAPTAYFYRVTSNGYGKRVTESVTLKFPAKPGRWRLYKKTSEKVGWLIVTKSFKIKNGAQSHSFALTGPTDFILVDDEALLKAVSFQVNKDKVAATLLAPVSDERPRDGIATVAVPRLRKGTYVQFGSVGSGTLFLFARDAKAEIPLSVEYEDQSAAAGMPQWKYRVKEGNLGTGSHWLFVRERPAANYEAEAAGLDGWVAAKADKGEYSVQFPFDAATDKYRVLISEQDGYYVADGAAATVGFGPGAYAYWSAIPETGVSQWDVRCDAAETSITIRKPSHTLQAWRATVTNRFEGKTLFEKILFKPAETLVVPCNGTFVTVAPVAGAFSGPASWYPTGMSSRAPKGYGAAMNVVPQNSWMTAEDLETGKKVTVKVVSTGPYANGRVIDFTAKAFAALRPTKQGVIPSVYVRPATEDEIRKVNNGKK